MDIRKSVDDQFSKLHPCMPVNTRIGIIGAGPSGLAAAYSLAKLGYKNVTVIEKHHTVAGMCESVDIGGKIYDLGGQVIAANSAPTITHLAKEVGAEFEEMDAHKLALIDSCTGDFRDMEVADDYVSIVSLTLKLQDDMNKSGNIGIRAISESAFDPTEDFLKLHGVKSLPKSVAYGYTASGYGYVQDMPYAYIHEFTRSSMAGKIRRIKGGYTSLWQKLSCLPPFEVLCNTEVVKVKRSTECASVTVKNASGDEKVMEFDKIILSGALAFRNGQVYRSSSTSQVLDKEVVELNKLEKELFSKVETIDYYTTVLKLKGFEHLPMGFFYFGEFMEDPTTIGNPVAMQRFYADTDVFLFWSYGDSVNITGPTVTNYVINVVKSMGGTVEEIILQRRFKYFPHVNTEDMKNGFFEKLESELQGFQNTYYVGGLMAFELTERNSTYSIEMVRRHFSSDTTVPNFPYVRRLFPLAKTLEPRYPRDLGELPGVITQDLPSLDSYLRFWGTNEITKNKTLYTWLNDEGNTVKKRTYAELHENASLVAQKLLTSTKPILKSGDRVLLVYIPGLEFVDAFFGCLRARIIPVPVLPPEPLQRGGQALLKIENISKNCNARAILSTSSYHAAVRAGFVKSMIMLGKNNANTSASWPDLPWIHSDSWIKTSKTSPSDSNTMKFSCLDPKANDLCFLQFTSGSTGEAKGVMITHGGLIHNVKMMRRRYRSTSKTVLVSWLPQYHDMGLIGGLFTALVSGGTAVLFSPMSFIRNPLMWLKTMSDYHATHSAGPNFAFELVLRRLEAEKQKNKTLTYDLSSMIFLMIAAEPVRQKTLKRFIEVSQLFGLSEEVLAPGYGLAENCVFVSCAFGEGRPIMIDWQNRVCCGYVNGDSSDVEIRIVEPETDVEIKECGKEGEIWISSPSAGIGYWGNEEQSQITFFNRLEKSPGKNYTRTGDLGRIIDGKLFITGRIKDLIIVAGRNIYSADVEKTVEDSSDFLRPGCCAVIGVPEDVLSSKGIELPETSDQVGLVVIAEVREGKHVNDEDVEQIKSKVAEEHGVSVVSIKLIKPKTICKTTSGKIRRFECLKQYVDETLTLAIDPKSSKKSLFRSLTTGSCRDRREPPSPIGRTPSDLKPSGSIKNVKEITEFLRNLVSEQMGISIEKITATENLVSYGIDSIGVVRAAQKLSDFLGVPVGAVDIFTATCISDLATFSENLLKKSNPQLTTNSKSNTDIGFSFPVVEKTGFEKMCIGFLQLLVLTYVCSILILPAYVTSNLLLSFVSSAPMPVLSLLLAPLAWILYTALTCICLSIFGKSFMQPNYMLSTQISIWSVDFVKWWALNKAQEAAGRNLAIHLKGTIFLKHWFNFQGAQIGDSALIDTVDITDPSLVSIGEGAVIGEGVLIQSHEVKNGVLQFNVIKIGRNASVGPYAVLQKGSLVGENSEVLPLQKVSGENPVYNTENASKSPKGVTPIKNLSAFSQFMGIYAVGFLNALSGSILYFLYITYSQTPFTPAYFTFVCTASVFHWLPATLAAYAAIIAELPSNPLTFALNFSLAYVMHGFILIILTAASSKFLTGKEGFEQTQLRTWLHHRINISCHIRFAKLLSGTEAFCIYLRLLGAKIGNYCSIRAINPVVNPEMMSIGDGVHVGDFSRIVPKFYSISGFKSGDIEIGKNSVLGSQSLIMPGSAIQEDVILGALSIAPINSVLRKGGIYMGSETPKLVKDTLIPSDERIDDMDPKYKQILGSLAGNLAITTMKVKSRYFHRIGVAGKGVLKIYDHIPELSNHKIFGSGKLYNVIIRHSNSLSADDDARIDARGAALRIVSDDSSSPLLDLTLKTGKALYARTIADFANWLVCGLPAREQHVKRVPHIRDAVWGSLRNADSFAELHYYSNFARLLRFDDGREMYVKFKLRPFDSEISEDAGKVEPRGILPPETGAIPRDEGDTRPLLFLANDFRNRVEAPCGVRYIFQIQLQSVKNSDRETALDCTRPWDETKYPYIDVGEITIDENLSTEETERLEFNPYIRCPEIDLLRATSSTQSASIDHGRSLIYEICQHVRNGLPLPASWRGFLEQTNTKIDLSGCPMAQAMAAEKHDEPSPSKFSLARTWHQTLWATLCQPLLQTLVPYFILGLTIFAPLKSMFYLNGKGILAMHYLLPIFWVVSGISSILVLVCAKWALVKRKKEGDVMQIWSLGAYMDTIWQALRTIVGEFFMDMTCGSIMFVLWMRMMGAEVDVGGGVYVDSTGAMLNPEMVGVERGGSVEREAVLFGHIYEGEGGVVKFGKIRIEEGGFVGSRAVAMPGARVESGARLGALSLAMKEEIVRCR